MHERTVPADQEIPVQRGAFSGVPQDAVGEAEKTDFVPYEKMEIKEEAPENQPERRDMPELAIVDSEQDAGIVLEAAETVVKLEERKEEKPEVPEDSKEALGEEKTVETGMEGKEE